LKQKAQPENKVQHMLSVTWQIMHCTEVAFPQGHTRKEHNESVVWLTKFECLACPLCPFWGTQAIWGAHVCVKVTMRADVEVWFNIQVLR
jgi:hypothetical protein